MKPTKLTGRPWLEPNQRNGEITYPTDVGLLTKEEIGKLLNIKSHTFYERYRRVKNEDLNLKTLSGKLFNAKRPGGDTRSGSSKYS